MLILFQFGLCCPEPLHQVLIDDYDKVTKLGYWPKLPAKITISQIVKEVGVGEICLVFTHFSSAK